MFVWMYDSHRTTECSKFTFEVFIYEDLIKSYIKEAEPNQKKSQKKITFRQVPVDYLCHKC